MSERSCVLPGRRCLLTTSSRRETSVRMLYSSVPAPWTWVPPRGMRAGKIPLSRGCTQTEVSTGAHTSKESWLQLQSTSAGGASV